MPAQIVGGHELILRSDRLAVDELDHLDLGLLRLGRGLPRLHGRAEGAAEAIGGIHAPGLAGQDRLLVLLGDLVDE